MKRFVATGLLILFTLPASANPGLPEWAQRALQRGRTAVVRPAATSVQVAGVRGAHVVATELYWKDADPAPDALVAAAEEAEANRSETTALPLYRRALAMGASGRAATRAGIGVAVCELRLGGTAASDETASVDRLQMLFDRASDADLRYAAGLPLAVGLAASGQGGSALAVLRSLLADSPDHPLAGQADSLIFVLQEGR